MLSLSGVSYFNPYLQDTIAFYTQSSYSLTSTSHADILLDVDLYYQPLQSPVFAISNLLISVIILIVGEYVHIQVLKFLRYQTSLVKEILQAFMYIQMLYWPITVFFQGSTKFIYPFRQIFGDWYCITGKIWVTYGMTVILFHSFIVGLTRYLFVVHNEKVLAFGKDRAKNMTFWTSILMPLVVTIWGVFTPRQTAGFSSFNRCEGIHHDVFLIENNFGSTAKRNFCFFENYNEDGHNIPPIVKKVSCTLYSIVYSIMASNLVEGLLYWRTVRHSNRYVKL